MSILIGVSGGSGSGKSTLARALAQHFHAPCVSMDHYYRCGSDRPVELGGNYDHPDNFDWPLLRTHVLALKNGQDILRPSYRYTEGRGEPVAVNAAPIVLLEGILLLSDPEIARLLDHAIHLETDLEEQLSRRIARDRVERGVSEVDTRTMWATFVAPMHHAYVAGQSFVAHCTLDAGQHPDQVAQQAFAALEARGLLHIEQAPSSRSSRAKL